MMRRTCFLPVFGSSWCRGLFADLGEVSDKRGNQLCSALVWIVQPDQWSGTLTSFCTLYTDLFQKVREKEKRSDRIVDT